MKVLVRDEEDAEPGTELQAHAQNVVTTYLTLYQVSEQNQEENKRHGKSKTSKKHKHKKEQITI